MFLVKVPVKFVEHDSVLNLAHFCHCSIHSTCCAYTDTLNQFVYLNTRPLQW